MDVEITPSQKELLAVIALISRENDSLRERVGNCQIRFFDRTFSRNEIEVGLSLSPTAHVTRAGAVRVHLES